MAQLYPEDIGSITAARAFKHNYIVTITGTVPYAWSASFCSAGRTFVDAVLNTQVIQPSIIVDPDIVGDSGGPLRTSFTLAARGPVTIGSATYSDLYAALRVLEWMHAEVKISHRMDTQSGTETSGFITTRIVQITNMTALSVTFHVEQRIDLEGKRVPEYKLTRDLFTTDANKDQIPEDSTGKAIPVSWGAPTVYKGQYTGLGRSDIHNLYQFGVRPRGFPSVQIQKAGRFQRFAWSELVDLDVHPDNVYERDAFVYEPNADAWGWLWDEDEFTHDSSAGYLGKFNGFECLRVQWAKIPILCTSVSEPDTTGLTDGENALSPDMTTYATLETDGEAYFDVPSVNSMGRIAANLLDGSTNAEDQEYNPAPAGIVPFIVVSAEGDSVLEYQMYVTWPSTAAKGEALSNSVNLAATSTSILAWTIGVNPSKWTGTKFERWDFSAVGDSGEKLYNALNGASSGQFRIAVVPVGTPSVRLRIHMCGFQVGYLPTQVTGTGIFRPGREHRDKYPADRNAWTRGRVSSGFIQGVEELSNVYTVAYGYRDDGSGTYSGTPSAVLRNPASWLWNILDYYGGQSSITTGSSLGSFESARSDLNRWAGYANNGTSLAWDSKHTHEQQDSVSKAVDDILTGIPDSQVLRAAQGGAWRMHVWIPRYSSWSLFNSGTPVHPVHILDGSEGLALEFGTTDITTVINKLEIKYDRDPGSGEFAKTATCSSEGSDNGYGDEWAATPTTAVAAKDLCFWSKERYGDYDITVELPHIWDPRMATAVGLSILWHRYRPMPTVSLSATLRLYNMEPWHVFRFDDELEDKFKLSRAFWGTPSSGEGSTWENIWWRVTRSEQTVGSGGVRSMQIEAEWYPTEIGTGVSAGAGTEPYGVEAMGIGDLGDPAAPAVDPAPAVWESGFSSGFDTGFGE